MRDTRIRNNDDSQRPRWVARKGCRTILFPVHGRILGRSMGFSLHVYRLLASTVEGEPTPRALVIGGWTETEVCG